MNTLRTPQVGPAHAPDAPIPELPDPLPEAWKGGDHVVHRKTWENMGKIIGKSLEVHQNMEVCGEHLNRKWWISNHV